MKNEERKRRFEEKYARFLLSEIVTGLMQQEKLSVRTLARAMGVSPTVIQDIRSGKRKNITLKNLFSFAHACHAKIRIERGNETFSLFG